MTEAVLLVTLLLTASAVAVFRVQTVVTRVYDPHRAELFGRLGLRTFSPTNISADLAYQALLEDR